MSSIGIYGGNFNPVHVGHLITAQRVLELRNLDKIIFMPAYISPFKEDIPVIEPIHRLHMLKIALGSKPFFEISDFEFRKEGVSYSIDTLSHFKSIYTDIDLIIGFDNLLEFTAWREPDEIIRLANLVVLKRGTTNIKTKQNKFFADAIFPDTPIIEISSTEIRNRIRENKSIDFLVPEAVKEYIYQNNLYKE